MKNTKLILTTVIMAVILLLSGCSNADSEAKESFEDMMSAFKSCDESQIDLYYDFDKVSAYIEETDGEEFKEAILSTLSKIEYKINSSKKVNSDAVRLNVDITTVDFSAITEKYIAAVVELVNSDEYRNKIKAMTDDEYKSLMAEQMILAIEEGGAATKTKTIDVTMKKNGVVWELGGDTRLFLGTLFENLSNAVNSLI